VWNVNLLAVLLLSQVSELTEEQKEYLAKMEANKEGKAAEEVETKGPTSFFHGKESKDYQVREWAAMLHCILCWSTLCVAATQAGLFSSHWLITWCKKSVLLGQR
jgi:hypothetical protein